MRPLLLGCLVLVGCHGCKDGGPPDSDDAGADEEPPEQPDVDAGEDGMVREASVDGPIDGGDADATRAPRGPYPDAGWEQLPGLPEECVVERATRPGRIFEARWGSCPGLDGCRMLPPVDGVQRRIAKGVGAYDGERGIWGWHEHRPGEPDVLAVVTTDGAVLAAWRMPNRMRSDFACYMGRYDITESAVGTRINMIDSALANQEYVYHAPHDRIGDVSEPTAVLTRGDIFGSNSQTLRSSDEAVALEIQSLAVVGLITHAGDVRIVEPAGEVSGTPQHVTVVGTHAIWEDWPGGLSGTSLAHATMSEGPASYHRLPDGDIKGFDTDGGRLAWLQLYDRDPSGGYARIELWTAPYARDPAELRPRKVRDMDSARRGHVKSDFYAIVTTLYDLDDGSSLRFRYPDGWGVGAGLLYVSEDEILVGGSNRDEGDTVFRIDRDALVSGPAAAP